MIKVNLIHRPGRKIECQWKDPVTNRLKTKSTGTKKERDAQKFAGALEADLNAGRHNDIDSVAWETLADRYESEALPGLAGATALKWAATRNAVEEIIDPKYAIALDASQISLLQAGLRKRGLKPATIKSHLATLQAALSWAHGIRLLHSVPHIAMPKRTGKMKGRPITTEEYERMRSVLPKCSLGPFVATWDYLLQGLWLSGLRLDEALRLNWERGPLTVNLSSGRPRLKIEANADKSTKPRLLPLATDFAEFLLKTPIDERRGRVFRPVLPDQLGEMRLDTCSKVITRIGKKAGVLVAEGTPRPHKKQPDPSKAKKTGPTDEDRGKKWASAHDFRRAFGTRWSKVIAITELQELMRHASIQTTKTFYIEDEISSIEDSIDRGMLRLPNSIANSAPENAPEIEKT